MHNLNKLEYFIRPIKKNIFSELLAFWKVYLLFMFKKVLFIYYILNTW